MRHIRLLIALAFLGLVACDRNPLDVAIDAALDFGDFTAPDGMVISVEGNEAVVRSFGSSPLGSNRSVFDVGGQVLRNIRTTSTSGVFTAEVLSPTFQGGVLASVSYADGELRIMSEDELRITGVSNIPTSWARAPVNPTSTGECRAYWDPILINGSTWEVVSWLTEMGQERIGVSMEDVTFAFYSNGQARTTFTNVYTGEHYDSGLQSYAHNYHFTSPLDGNPPWCRVTGVGTWFPVSFENGTLFVEQSGSASITLKAN
jgi:hypothetical protein